MKSLQRFLGWLLLSLVLLASSVAFSARAANVLTVCPSGCAYSSIQAAVDAAASGDTVNVLDGFYAEYVVIDSKSLTLKGAGREQVTVASSSEPPGFSFGPLGLWVKGRMHVNIEGFRIEGESTGVLVDGPDSTVTIRNSTIATPENGVIVESGAYLELYDNVFLKQYFCGLDGKFNEKPVSGAGNRFINSILCGNVDPVLRVPLATLTDKAEIHVPQEYASIQEAVDAVKPGGTILVEAGYFIHENISITKSLTLKGFPGLLPTTIDGDGRTVISTIMQAENVTLEGFDIQSSSDGSPHGSVGILIAGSPQVTIKHNHIRVTGDGIDMGPLGPPAGSVTIEDNIIELNGRYGIVVRAQEALILNNRIVANGGDGIYVIQPTVRVGILDNQIVNNGANEYLRSINAGWGISADVGGCDTTFFTYRPFSGEVIGGGNEIRGNGNGDVCPESLTFLMKQ